jgi:hypothetical protein
MNRKSIVIGSAFIASLFAVGLTGPALAQTGAGARADAPATSVDQSKIDAIHKKYDGDLTRMEAQLRITERDLDQALADQDSAKAAELRQKLADQQREYFGLRAKAWRELREAGYPNGPYGMMGGYGPYGMMGPGYGMMRGYGPYGMMGRGYGMMGGYGPYGMMNGYDGGCTW